MRAIDLFCGAGGSSWGARRAGAEIVAGCDLSPLAGRVFRKNFPNALFHECRLENLDPNVLARTWGPVDLLLASPECTNHSPAKGKGPRCEKSKDTAFQVIRFARVLEPRWIVVENVVSMRRWAKYSLFIDSLRNLGYAIRVQVLDSSDFGVPQTRRRLFVLCDREVEPPDVTPEERPAKSAATLISGNGSYDFTPLCAPNRAKATLERADRAISELGSNKPFLLVYYGSDHAGGWQPLSRPLRTVTTLDRFALVKPTSRGHVMRMLQVPELKAAMAMPKCFRIDEGTRRDQIKLVGNAVCPPVMRSVVKSLTAQDRKNSRRST